MGECIAAITKDGFLPGYVNFTELVPGVYELTVRGDACRNIRQVMDVGQTVSIRLTAAELMAVVLPMAETLARYVPRDPAQTDLPLQ